MTLVGTIQPAGPHTTQLQRGGSDRPAGDVPTHREHLLHVVASEGAGWETGLLTGDGAGPVLLGEDREERNVRELLVPVSQAVPLLRAHHHHVTLPVHEGPDLPVAGTASRQT